MLWIDISSNSKLDCMRCTFKGDGDNYRTINVGKASTLSVVECVFDNCGGLDDDPVIRIDDAKSVCLKIIGNTFTKEPPTFRSRSDVGVRR